MAQLLNREKIRRELHDPLNRMVDDVLSAIGPSGATLRSAALYGSATGPHYAHKKSNINLLLIFSKIDLEMLRDLRGVFNRHEAQFRGRPVALDMEFIDGSHDVFPMEFLEWKERHVLIYGEDLLSGIVVSPTHLRHEIEENLRRGRMLLIQEFFRVDSGKGALLPFLETTLPHFTVCARNILRLLGAPIADDIPDMCRECATKTGASLSSLIRLHEIKTRKLRIGRDETEILFQSYLNDVDGLIDYIDKFSGDK